MMHLDLQKWKIHELQLQVEETDDAPQSTKIKMKILKLQRNVRKSGDAPQPTKMKVSEILT